MKGVVTGESGSFFKLRDAVKVIDFSDENMIEDAITVGHITHGAFTYNDLRGFPFRTYTTLVNKSLEFAKKINDSGVK